ncbi:AbrB/MazE/SpoVT family DNA-binding domain-containing protein [Lacticaseibacillus zeae]|uniref:AbrB/MazE/SpoVT family DNA-binding domain-containing protein n=1 Tax=Lacticaseibacillus zeae subsp. silagei TaxID=3068307 RepID=A0ABD7Z7N6_LACZE|nr:MULTISPECIES: AbrB/MazE/SpoVT family DNA-binding domain-containing protein [Lacticaseibacillus]MDE3315984.1 AbrB/MazE/SpoVT family DNA-binding domain-containing protein [Lacticaseibacillus zeae]OFS01440.1 AbrB family transcriptional regulator [Lactobacillus sp. HMSC068F07]WLV83026.1 AbrB/MazE/SpoVT family DNA-binding domain-containing protein [Lacticaseibacillus sp. NCIMB 15475]WLV85775.1 AbrB/MazE/SpoVT family DNA-binding domain-containing protein [Lacticaseibacillus sp. NCIMB 15474]
MRESKRNSFRATMSSKGQVTIPSEIRRLSGIKKNTQLEFSVQTDGDLSVRVVHEKDGANEEKLIKTIRRLQKQYRIGLDYLKNK